PDFAALTAALTARAADPNAQTTSKVAIMEWSSWASLWQCMTYLPENGANLAMTRTIWPTPTSTVSFQPRSYPCGGLPAPSLARAFNRFRAARGRLGATQPLQ